MLEQQIRHQSKSTSDIDPHSRGMSAPQRTARLEVPAARGALPAAGAMLAARAQPS
jgi:hypothetical protein